MHFMETLYGKMQPQELNQFTGLSSTTETHGGEAMAIIFLCPQHMLGDRTVLFHAAI